MTQKSSYVSDWLGIEKDHPNKVNALENASRNLSVNHPLTINSVEAIYGQETSFGDKKKLKGKRGGIGPSGHFQLDKRTAERYGPKITAKNDWRYDIDDSSYFAAMHLNNLNGIFSKDTILDKGIKTIAIINSNDRKLFIIAAYNAGEGRIAKAQAAAQKDGKDPTNWNETKNYLIDAGAPEEKALETINYVDKVTGYEEEFSKKSKANKNLKGKKPKKLSQIEDGHWITLNDGRHIIVDKKYKA